MGDAIIDRARHRRSVRLQDYDYATPGADFVTVCTQVRQSVLGEIVDGSMRLNDIGRIVESCWYTFPGHFPLVGLDAFAIMPDHVHGIINLHESVGAGFPRPSMTQGAETAPLRRHPLGQIIAYFKYQSTKAINAFRNTPGAPVWQRNYYEHVIRNEDEPALAREYIVNNPLRWALDHGPSQQRPVGAHGCASAWLQRH